MKRIVILYIAMSLDGFIADENGGVAWLNGQGTETKPDNSYSEFIKNIDTVILGMTTYNQVITELSPQSWPYEDIKSYVFTSKSINNIKSKENIEFINSDIVKFIENLKNQEGKDIWICGGASIVNQLVEHNLIDEYHLTIIPTILGKGIRLFSNNNQTILLKCDKTVVYDGMVTAIYSKREG